MGRSDHLSPSSPSKTCSRTRSVPDSNARSGDPIAIAAYLGGSDTFDRALAEFAEGYADQNERDHQVLADAVKDGRVTAESI